MKIQKSVSLKPFTSWSVGGSADFYAQPTSEAELREALLWAKQNEISYSVLGGGTNVLISDKGVRGLVIHLTKLNQVAEYVEQQLVLVCECGVPKSKLLKAFLKHKLAPALFLAGLPGDVGGGVVMNAGVAEGFKPREFMELVNWIDVMRDDGRVERLTKNHLDISYRHCRGWEPGIILRVGISWPLAPDAGILEKVKLANATRLKKQPLDMPSCGSVFVNPEGYKAGQLIESSGLKGFAIGGAQVSAKHANFIVNKLDATAEDIASLIEHVKRVVLEKTKVRLKTEVVYLGEW